MRVRTCVFPCVRVRVYADMISILRIDKLSAFSRLSLRLDKLPVLSTHVLCHGKAVSPLQAVFSPFSSFFFFRFVCFVSVFDIVRLELFMFLLMLLLLFLLVLRAIIMFVVIISGINNTIVSNICFIIILIV